MAIDSFQILVPTVITAGETFDIEVRALDVDGNVISSDNTTQVTLSSVDPNIVFDGDEDTVFNEAGDATRTLNTGYTVFKAKDAKSSNFTLTAADGNGNTGSHTIEFNFNCLRVTFNDVDPPTGTATKDHYRFFEERINVNNPTHPIPPIGPPTTESFTSFLDPALDVLVKGDLVVGSDSITLNDGDPVSKWDNRDPIASFSLAQTTSTNAPTYGAGTPPVVRFDGTNDWMDVLNSDLISVIPQVGDFSVSLFMSLNDVSKVQAILSQYVEAAGNGRISFRYNGGLEVYLGGDGSEPTVQVTGGPLSTGKMYYIVFEREGNVFNVYVDNEVVASHTDSGTRNLLQEGAVVGARSTDSTDYKSGLTEHFDGEIVKIEIMQRILSGVEKNTYFMDFDANYQDGLLWQPSSIPETVAWFDTTQHSRSGSISKWVELTGKHTVTQNSTSTSYDPSLYGTAINDRPTIYFDGSSDHLHCDSVNSELLQAGGSFTMSFVVAPDFSKTGTVIGFWDGNGGNTFMLEDHSNGTFRIYDGSSGATPYTSVYTTGDVCLITWLFDADTGAHEVYINDVLEISYTSNQRLQSGGQFSLGQDWDGGSISGYYKGHFGALLVGAGVEPHVRQRFEEYLTFSYYGLDHIPDVSVWLEADDLLSGHVEGDPVTSWSDKSGSANNASQATTSLQPVFNENAIEDKPGVVFGSGDRLELPTAFANTSSDEFTAIALAQNNIVGAGTLLTTSNAAGEGWTLGYDASGNLTYEHEGFESLTRSIDTTVPHIATLRRSGLNVELGRRGDFQSTATMSGYTASSGTLTFMGSSSTEADLDGRAFDLACANRALKDREIHAIARQFQLRHVLSATKPAITGVNFEFDAHDLTGYVAQDLVPTLPNVAGSGDATQANTALQAKYFPHLLGGRPCIHFSSAQEYTSSVVPATGANPRMLVVVMGPRDVNNSYNYVAAWGSPSNLQFQGLASCWGGNFRYATTHYSADTPGSAPAGKPEVVITAYDGTTEYMWVNGEQVGEKDLALNTGSTHSLTFGRNPAVTSQAYEGYLGYAMTAAHFPSSEEVDQLTIWLARKFNVVL